MLTGFLNNITNIKRKKAEKLVRQEEIERKQRELEQKRQTIEAQITELKTQFEDEKLELD